MTREYQDGFVRQRRSLFVMTIVLTVVFTFGISGSEIRVGPGGGTGLTVDLVDTRYVYAGLLSLWAWFLYRYWQYWRAVRSAARKQLTEAQAGPIFVSFAHTLTSLAKQKVIEATHQGEENVDRVEILRMTVSEDGIRNGWKSVTSRVDARTMIGRGTRKFERNIKTEVSITGLKFYWLLLRAIIPTNLRHPYFTEYPPPLLFVIPPLIAAVLRWDHW